MDERIYLDEGTKESLVKLGKSAYVFFDTQNNLVSTRSLSLELNNKGYPYVLVDDFGKNGVVTATSIVVFGSMFIKKLVPEWIKNYHRDIKSVKTVPLLLEGAYFGKPGIESRPVNLRLLVKYADDGNAESNLPQLCSKCRILFPADEVTRKKKPNTHNKWYWVCNSCDSKWVAPGRDRRPTPPEWDAINAAVASKLRFIREYKIEGEKFYYDLCFPELSLLIEVDSETWHNTPKQKKKDKVKEALAISRGFKIARVRRPDIEGQVQAIIDRVLLVRA